MRRCCSMPAHLPSRCGSPSRRPSKTAQFTLTSIVINSVSWSYRCLWIFDSIMNDSALETNLRGAYVRSDCLIANLTVGVFSRALNRLHHGASSSSLLFVNKTVRHYLLGTYARLNEHNRPRREENKSNDSLLRLRHVGRSKCPVEACP